MGRYLISVHYSNRDVISQNDGTMVVKENDNFTLPHLTDSFDANVRYPKKVERHQLKPLETKGLYIPNAQANTLENSWEMVSVMEEIKYAFKKVLKSENIKYLYNHYEGRYGIIENHIVREVGKQNAYIVKITDSMYPVYNSKGEMTDTTIHKVICAFEIDASDYMPIKEDGFKPDLSSIYRGARIRILGKTVQENGLFNEISSLMEDRNLSNRFDNVSLTW